MDVFALTLRLKEEGAASVKASVDKLRDSYSKGARSADAYSRATSGVTSALKGMFATIGIAATVRKFVDATATAEFAQSQLASAIRATSESAGQSLKALNDHASALQRVSTFGDEAINKAQARLLTYTNIVGDQFPRATEVVLDYAAAFNVDLVQASEAVGKALNFPSVGMAALAKQGFILTASQKALIRELESTGRIAEAQAIIFAELESVTKGAALAARDTLGGALQALSNAFGDLFEITNGASGALTRFVNRMAFVLGALNENRRALLLLGGGIAATTTALLALIFHAEIAAARMAVIAGAQIASGFVRLARSIGLAAAAMELFGKAGPMRLLGIATAVAGAAAAFVGLRKATNDSSDAFAAFEKAIADAQKPLAALGGDGDGSGIINNTTSAIVDQVAALMRLVELMPITRAEAGVLAREERQLQNALAGANLTYADRVALLERLLAVQKARESMRVRLTRDELMAVEFGGVAVGVTAGGTRAIPQIRPSLRNGQLVAGGAPQDMIATAMATLERDAAAIRERTAALVDTARVAFADRMESMAQFVAEAMRDTFVDGIADGISEAIRTGSIGEGFKSLTRTMLSSLGSMLVEFGRALLPIGALFAKLRASLVSMNPLAVTAVALGTIALGSMMRGAAQSAFGAGAPAAVMAGGIGSLGVGGSTVTRTFSPTMAGGTGASVQAVTPMQVTIVGPNDPNAQRQIAQLMDNAARRGLVQGAGVRTL
jgi:hypothetical protein